MVLCVSDHAAWAGWAGAQKQPSSLSWEKYSERPLVGLEERRWSQEEKADFLHLEIK